MAKESNKPSVGDMLDEEALLHDNTFSPKDDRRDRGRIMRATIPHEAHAGWRPAENRPNVVDFIEESNKGRLPELIPLRYGRMLGSPFTFFRGSAALMAFDLSSTPTSKIPVQACGDCHLLNFGAFASPERHIVFDINDFDETLPAPWEWDLKRLAVSFVLAARENGLKPKVQTAVSAAVCRAYREGIAQFSKMSILDIWYHHVGWEQVIASTSDADLQKKLQNRLTKELKRGIQDYYFPKLAEQVDGGYQIKESPPSVFHYKGKKGKDFRAQIERSFVGYVQTLQEDRQRLLGRYKLEDVALKVVGIGSVGTLCAVALLMASDDEPLFLQIKEARPSVLQPFCGKSAFENNGQRVVAGQRIIQSASDIFLGWTKFEDGRHFYVRQLRDTKVKPEPELWDGPRAVEAAQVMGAVLAKAHARSGDAAVIRGYLGTEDSFDRAVCDFAQLYADQTEVDYEHLVNAVKSGRIKSQTEFLDE